MRNVFVKHIEDTDDYTIDEWDFGKVYRKRGTKTTHRVDGPAYECHDGSNGWFLDGKRFWEFDEYLAAHPGPDDLKVYLVMMWS